VRKALRARRVAALAVVAGSAALVAGCGSGGGDRLSRGEFVSQADAICEEYEGKLDALGAPQNAEQLGEFADQALPIAREGRDKLGELRPPEDLEGTYDDWLEQGDRSIELVEDLQDAAEDQDSAEIQRIAQRAEAIDSEANRLAGELGFEQCGAAGSATP
jgi:hypothetical protein